MVCKHFLERQLDRTMHFTMLHILMCEHHSISMDTLIKRSESTAILPSHREGPGCHVDVDVQALGRQQAEQLVVNGALQASTADILFLAAFLWYLAAKTSPSRFARQSQGRPKDETLSPCAGSSSANQHYLDGQRRRALLARSWPPLPMLPTQHRRLSPSLLKTWTVCCPAALSRCT